MRSGIFIAIVILSGFISGLTLGFINFVTTEPYLDSAIELENREIFNSLKGEQRAEFQVQYDSYREWQKSGMVLAGGILGVALGSLFGIVFALSRNILPGKHHIQKTLFLGGLMWLTVFLIPFLKYPANPPTVGDPETVVLRSILYLSFIAISGLGTVGCYQIYKKLQNKKFIAFVSYTTFISLVFVLMPSNPDEVNAPMDLVNGFRIMSVISISIFWLVNALVLGALWQKFKPHSSVKEMEKSNS